MLPVLGACPDPRLSGKRTNVFFSAIYGRKYSMMKKLRPILDILQVLLGNCIYAFGVAAFIKPSGIIAGGTTGIGLALNRLFQTNISLFVLIVNTSLFILGFFVLGKKFAATTALSTFAYPVFLEMWQRVMPAQGLTQDMLLCTVFGSLCIGVAIGMAMRVGASTGGMDIPPLVLNKLLGLPIAGTLYFCDMAVLLSQSFFATWDQILYGILHVLLYTVILNKVLLLGKNKVEIKIISQKNAEIRNAVIHRLDRGVTLLKSRTGFRQEETETVLTVITARELNQAEKLIHQIDPDAFMIVSQVKEVAGRGFSLKKEYLAESDS